MRKIIYLALFLTFLFQSQAAYAFWPFHRTETASVADHKKQESFACGYERGYAAAHKRLSDESKVLMEKLKEKISRKFILISLIMVLATLFGPAIIERLRNKIKFTFNIPLPVEIAIWYGFYSFVAITFVIWSLKHHATIMNIPIFIIIAGTIYPFAFTYINAVKNNDKAERKLASSKIKSLFFFAFVIMTLYYLLENKLTGIGII